MVLSFSAIPGKERSERTDWDGVVDTAGVSIDGDEGAVEEDDETICCESE